MKSPAALTQPGFENQTSKSDSNALLPNGANVLRYLTRKEQYAVILAALRAGPKTTDNLRELGSYMPNSRVHEIRAFGFSIQTDLVQVVGIDGRLRKMALYTLNEPSDNWVRPVEGGE